MKTSLLKALGGALVAALAGTSASAQMVTGPSTTTTPYQVPVATGVKITSVLTVGDTIGGYRMVGIPDGIGAWDNGNGTWTLLCNHELGNTSGAVRAHGSRGAFVSKWVISKDVNSMQVLSGADLTQRVHLYNRTTGTWTAYGTNNPMDTSAARAGLGRFCSGDVPAVSAFYNSATGKGTQERFIMNGEETGADGRVFAHLATGPNAGNTYEVPHLGKSSWENYVANPRRSDTTILIGTDDATPGQVWVYVGVKQSTGNEIQRAGLVGGKLYGVAVTGFPLEANSPLIPAGTAFTLVPIDTVEKMTGSQIESVANALGVTRWLRPEDGAWDPRNPSDFYVLTTNAFSSPSRMWRLRFNNIGNPAAGGTVTAVLEGTEGQRMMDNLGIDNNGFALIQEDVGGNNHLGKTWQYNIANDSFKVVLQYDSLRFSPGAPNYIANDEESSGMIDMQEILGAGYFFGVSQVHRSAPGELVEMGQMFLLYNPDAYNANAEISLSGNGVQIPNNATAPSTANNTDFGNISAGSTTTRTFSISNAGPAALTITGMNMTGANPADFTLVGASTFPLTLAAGASQTVTVQFAPSSVGLRTATMNIQSNDFDESTYTVALRGVGLNASGIAALAGGGAAKLYPNPTGNLATVELSLTAAERIQLSLLDMQGRQVVSAVDSQYGAGDHKVSVNTGNLPNGTYFVQLTVGNSITRMKLVVAH